MAFEGSEAARSLGVLPKKERSWGVIETLDAAEFGQTISRSSGATLVLFATGRHRDTKALCLMLEAAGAQRDWALFWVDPTVTADHPDPQQKLDWARTLGLTSLPALWLYLNGDYHANVFSMAAPAELARPGAIAAAVARARWGPPMPPPGA